MKFFTDGTENKHIVDAKTWKNWHLQKNVDDFS